MAPQLLIDNAAVLGTEVDKNLFVDDQGCWGGRYVPAFVHRYPFVFADGADGKTFTVSIDARFAGCNRDGGDERLFDAEGERPHDLNTVLNFVEVRSMGNFDTLPRRIGARPEQATPDGDAAPGQDDDAGAPLH